MSVFIIKLLLYCIVYTCRLKWNVSHNQ